MFSRVRAGTGRYGPVRAGIRAGTGRAGPVRAGTGRYGPVRAGAGRSWRPTTSLWDAVDNGVCSYWPSKTQCVLKILGKEIDSVAEWWRSCTQNHSFCNDICDLWVRCIKTISFYNDLCVSKHPCFIVVLLRAQRIMFYYIFGDNWSHKHHILQKDTVFTMNYACLRTIIKMHEK